MQHVLLLVKFQFWLTYPLVADLSFRVYDQTKIGRVQKSGCHLKSLNACEQRIIRTTSSRALVYVLAILLLLLKHLASEDTVA